MYASAMPPDAAAFDFPACLDLVRTGDQDAARDLVEHLYPQVVRIVRPRLPRRLDEEDLVQEVFLKMFARLEQYRGDVPFSHWLSRIAVTTCIDQLRKQQRRPELRYADLSAEEAEVLEVVTRDEKLQPVNDAVAARELLEKLLEQLDPADRLLVQLLDLEQKSLAEASELLGTPVTVLKVRAFRARRKLRNFLKSLEKEEIR
jgi:RNA polymerase sigma-70 factor (ECF subfamily)